MVCFPNGLAITPTHPILDSVKGWVFPKDLRIPGVIVAQIECEEVFNILLDSKHTVVVNGTVCAVLGHERDGHTRHEFWGNWQAVANCLKSIDPEGFDMGRVEVVKNLRDRETQRVNGFEGRNRKVGLATELQH
ncbi:hypothetical protein OIDMADRAFT_20583 [Oidiodendron maius Zn]|uniref:Vint domain-containing protein n=1 Tax=Oidiodendron maius (strain Zn) TaxID=913774 RepID=A0A0C3H4S0_OIDMZ|nr:hypothetical protein OIDMADRAFT_20583 [Oidiodendron maius Zn]